jgi:hypothetical protein
MTSIQIVLFSTPSVRAGDLDLLQVLTPSKYEIGIAIPPPKIVLEASAVTIKQKSQTLQEVRVPATFKISFIK